MAFPTLLRVALADPAAVFAQEAGGQHPRQTFFIFAFSFEISSARRSASGRWLRVLDAEIAWSGVLDPGWLECSATQAGEALSRHALGSLAFDIDSSVARSTEVPSEIMRKWQEIVNLLGEIMHVPSASMMRVDPPDIKVFVSSTSEGNPCEPGALDTGPYCEIVMKTGQPLLIPDALENEAWKANPHVRLGMISYLGVPIGWPNGRIFGTICVRDNKRNELARLISSYCCTSATCCRLT
jgi:GAF domain-containing protein